MSAIGKRVTTSATCVQTTAGHWAACLGVALSMVGCETTVGSSDDDPTTGGAGTGANGQGGNGGVATGGAPVGGGQATGGTGGVVPSVETWFRTDFDEIDAAGPSLYDFANRFAQSESTWQTIHTDQGFEGSGAPHVTIHGCAANSPMCNTSEHQFTAGWATPALDIQPTLGDSAFIRYRIRFDPQTNFPIEKFGAKFILFGTTGTSPNSRWIIHLMPPFENQGCTLGFDYSFMGWAPPSGVWSAASDWGFANDFDHASILGRYASFQSSVNIGWDCNPAVLVTRSDHSAPVPAPQSLGSAPVDGWYHLQFQAVSGNDGQADFRTWANNNDQAMPSTERLDMPNGLGVEGWALGVNVVGYWGTADMPDLGFIIDDFEVGPVFDPNWAR